MADFASNEEILADLEKEEGAEPEPKEGVEGEPPAPTEEPWNAPAYVMLGDEKVEWGKAQTWLSQGRHFSQNQAKFNQERQAWEAERKKFGDRDKRFGELDAFVATPEGQQWWAKVQESWNNRQLPQGADPAVAQAIQPLLEQIKELTAWKESSLKKEQEVQAQTEDKALGDQVASTREKFANIDFDAIDQSGKTLELRVYDHMLESGINSFNAAFLDYYQDQLFSIAKADAKVDALKAKEVATRQGIKPKEATPRQGGHFDFKSKGMKEDEMWERIKQEINQ